ncbi:hypothetical protein HY945_04665 [Candidatus Gottesmanbacteria bacterium]|nr:hypothetical protein [Candidatus Gottesmanbacteria bacterium]
MRKYSVEIVTEIRRLRSLGKTYSEIINQVRLKIPKSTLSDLVQGVILPPKYVEKISKLNATNLDRGRKTAWIINSIKRKEFLEGLSKINHPIAEKIKDKEIAKIALAMLCLGEASKYATGGGRFSLGSSDHKIIVILLELLKICFDVDMKKIRATVQCRADQNTANLERYWRKITGIPKGLFYKPLIDPRTKGKPTKRKNYMGVLRIDYFDTKLQLELESLAELVYNNLLSYRARSLAG